MFLLKCILSSRLQELVVRNKGKVVTALSRVQVTLQTGFYKASRSYCSSLARVIARIASAVLSYIPCTSKKFDFPCDQVSVF